MNDYPKTRKEAVAANSEYYRTGIPCKRGHIAPRSVSRKGCVECLREKERSPQERERKRLWKQENPDLQYQYRQKYQHRYSQTPEGMRRIHAQNILRGAVKKGKVRKPDHCSRCGDRHEIIHGHHWDYDKPREVEWVCPSCHVAIHRVELAAAPQPEEER